MPKIVIEGIDGSGKSSLIATLKQNLAEFNRLSETPIDFEFLAEPTDDARAKLREAAKNGNFHEAAPEIFLNDRKGVVGYMEEGLLDGKTYIIDRHLLSTIAYQGVTESPEKIALDQLSHFAPADLTILLDLPAETALARLGVRSEAELQDDSNAQFEKLEFQKKVRRNYHRFVGLASEKVVVIDATRPPEAVASIATGAILALLGRGGAMPQSIFCVPRESLVREGLIKDCHQEENHPSQCLWFQGDKTPEKALEAALEDGLWVERVLAEENPDLKQIIPAIMVMDPNGGLLYYTRRGKETRLHRKISINLGGHIDPEDVADTNFFNPSRSWGWDMICAGAARELREELGSAANHCSPPQIVGVINDDSNAVGQVHFGVLMSTSSKLTLHLRHNEETGTVQTATIAELKEKPNLEGWAKAILATL